MHVYCPREPLSNSVTDHHNVVIPSSPLMHSNETESERGHTHSLVLHTHTHSALHISDSFYYLGLPPGCTSNMDELKP